MDDVQYLLQQGKAAEQSFLFVVDSAMRDRTAYPTPSDYYIPFPIPFRNVFAVDLIEAVIPRTEYSIESTSNILCYAPGSWGDYESARRAGTLVTVTLQPGDYNTPQLIEALNLILTAAALKPESAHVPLVVEAVGDPVSITNKIKFTRPEPFVIFGNQSTLRNWIGFGNPPHAPNAAVAWDKSARFTTDSSVANDIFIATPATLTPPTPAFAGPVQIEVAEYAVDVTSTIRQIFTASASGLLDSLSIKGTQIPTTPLNVSIYDVSSFSEAALVQTVVATSANGGWKWTADPAISQSPSITPASAVGYGTFVTITTATPHSLVAGNIIKISDATTLAVNGRWMLTGATASTFTFDCGADITIVLLGKAVVYAPRQLLAETVYSVEISHASNGVVKVYKAETFSTDPRNQVDTLTNGEFVTLSSYDALCMDVNVSNVGYKVEPPGQCNLTGERYVLVRSPDIEQHLHRDLATAFDRMAPGLGLLKLGGTGFRNDRFDFFEYKSTRKFHPIGKLKGLRIRLETRSGRLYDAHGIDHTLLLSVKMYAVGPSTSIPRDLFPGYTPNARTALTQKLERERDM